MFLRLENLRNAMVGIAWTAMSAIGLLGQVETAHAETTMETMSDAHGVKSPMPGHDMKSANAGMQDVTFDRDTALGISRAAIGNKIIDYTFTASTGQEVSLGDFAGKPYLINFIYTSCMHTCPMIVETLSRSVDVAREALGQDSFTVLTIGFDTPNDSVDAMAAYSRVRGVGDDNWLLLSGDDETVRRLAEDLGFLYKTSPMGYDHLAQVSVVDETSVVYRQIYGVNLTAPVVVEPLKQLVFGRKTGYTSFSGLTNQVKLFCTIYDPSTGRYKFDTSFIISIVLGLVFLTGAGFLFIRSWWLMRQRRKAT